MNWKNHIESKPEVLYGKPVIKGTRIGVDLILEKLSYGESVVELQEAYPHISAEDIYACLAYATVALRNEESYFLAPAV